VSRVRTSARFLWDFVVGDDWRIAAGVVLALVLTALIADTSVPAWWILPVLVAMLLAASVMTSTRRRV
jgi:hypothetical protein